MFCENLVLLILTEGMWFTAVRITVAFLGNHFFYNCVCSNEIIICVFYASDTFCPRGLCMFKTVSAFCHAGPTVYFRHNKTIHSVVFSRKPNFFFNTTVILSYTKGMLPLCLISGSVYAIPGSGTSSRSLARTRTIHLGSTWKAAKQTACVVA